MTRNVKIIERQLEWNDERGVWKYEFRDNSLMPSDVIEYWMYTEKNRLGFYSTGIVKIDGELFLIFFSFKNVILY